MYTKFPKEYDPSMPDEQASERSVREHDSYPQAVDKPVDNYAGRAGASPVRSQWRIRRVR
jgi:hypothetical protein